ncbi:MAG: hypothetical protein WAM28_05865 [Chlamydiales bacterium]
MKTVWFFFFFLSFPVFGETNDLFWKLEMCKDLPYFQPTSTEDSVDELTHECGIALVRLKKPIEHYAKHYGDPSWGITKLLLLMEKQRNRGQDGAGIAVVQLDRPSDQKNLHHFRSAIQDPFTHLVNYVTQELQKLKTVPIFELKQHSPFIGEIYLGHMRYATYKGSEVTHCQPIICSHSNPNSHFALAGNFNMSNTSQIRQQLKDWGISYEGESDSEVIAETIAYYLDRENEPSEIDIAAILKQAATLWDGGYVFCGALKNGNVFICRDPAGIRPGFYFENEEVIAAASEKIALMEAFDTKEEDILPIKPGHLLVIRKEGDLLEGPFVPPLPKKECVFERIYFSSANDPQIYRERKALGRMLAPKVFEALGKDLSHAVFTYVPNSALLSFQGLVEEIAKIAHQHTMEGLKRAKVASEEILKIPPIQPKVEFIVEKKKKLRTFISSDQIRKELVQQIYHVTQGIVTEGDTLVVVEDSIVRGTTLKESLIEKFIKLNPKKIIIVSSAPQICYPDCYGIDMSQVGRFVAFQAAASLLEEQGKSSLLQEVYDLCLKQKSLKGAEMQNEVKRIYELFSPEEISDKIAQLLTPSDTDWKGSIQCIYQSLEDLHQAIPEYKGEWYFSGNYPTPGGLAVLNNSYLKWFNHNDSRSY